MASTGNPLTDIIVPDIFSPYVQMLTEQKTKLVASGVLALSPELNSFCQSSTGGNTLNKPTWKDLDASQLEKIANTTDPSAFAAGAGLAPQKITSYNEIAVKLFRTQQWGAMKLAGDLAGTDPMLAIAGRVAHYEAEMLQLTALEILEGVFADNDAAPDVDDTHTEDDLTFNASGVGFVAGVTNFTAENLFDAVQTAGDSQEDFKILCVHSAVFSRMRKNNLIDFIQDSVTGANLATFQGMKVVYDDQMPKSGNVYHSYIFAPGALELGWGSHPKASEVVWAPDGGQGYGETILYRRRIYCVHPMGHAYIGAATGGGPTNDTLDNAASWSRRCPERKQVKIARLITREA
jgi:hypothetical protein